MPMELQIIRAQEFIRLGPQGHFDLKASKAVLAELARACCKRGINQALLDLRALHPGPKPVFSPQDLVTMVNTFHEVGFTHRQRLAVLYGSDPHHRARLFAFIATLRGWSVRAFDSFEKAITWLSHTHAPAEEIEVTPRAKNIPVRQASQSKKTTAKSKSASQPKIIVKSSPARRPAPTHDNLHRKPGTSVRATMAAAVLAMLTVTALSQPVTAAQIEPTNAETAASSKPSPFAPTIPNTTPAPKNAPPGMVWIPGGEFSMGCHGSE